MAVKAGPRAHCRIKLSTTEDTADSEEKSCCGQVCTSCPPCPPWRRGRFARRSLAARGESLASHRDGRGAPTTTPARLPRWGPRYRTARRPTGGAPTVRVVHGGVQYREYLSEEQRSRRGCIARRMQPDFHHGLLRACCE